MRRTQTNYVNDTSSFTASAVQRNWRTPCAFPACPDSVGPNALSNYLEQLTQGEIFSHNRFGESEVEVAEVSEDGSFLCVLTKIIDSVKEWGLVQVTVENDQFVHAALGTFFSRTGADKARYAAMGRKWDGEDSIDDYC